LHSLNAGRGAERERRMGRRVLIAIVGGTGSDVAHSSIQGSCIMINDSDRWWWIDLRNAAVVVL
jgi:hypothetical protein